MNGGQVWVGNDARVSRADAGPGGGEPFAWLPEGAEARGGEATAGVDALRAPQWNNLAVGLSIGLALAWMVGILAWTARTGWPTRPLDMVQLVGGACAFPVLLGIGWLLAAAAGGGYAMRLWSAARAMHDETDALGRSIAALDDVIESRRVALAEQVRSLEAIGDDATTRLQAIGSRLSDEIAAADRYASTLGESVGAAQTRLNGLLAAMPHAREEVTALGGELHGLALSAGEQIVALDGRLAALAESGRGAEASAGGAAKTLAAHLTRMETTNEAIGAQLTDVTAQIAEEVDALLGRTANAVDQSRAEITAQGEAMIAMLGAHQVALETAARESAEGVARQAETVELMIDRVAKRLSEQRINGDAVARDMDERVGQSEERLTALQREGAARMQSLAQSIAALGGSADAMTTALREGDASALKAISSAETLLIALDSAAREMDETLPAALVRLDEQIGGTRQRIAATKPELIALVSAAESTHTAVDAVAVTLAEQRRSAEAVATTLVDGLARGRDKVAGLEHSVEATIERVDGFVESAAPRLIEALLRVRDTATAAADTARDTLAEVIPEAAHALELASEAAFRRAAGARVQDQVAAVAEVAEAAVAAATRAADQLERQLARVEQATERLDTGIAEARAERDVDERESFARRSSQLIEMLNSAAIDIHRSLAPDVSDTAWSAYLKGDRGVFTRRAVRLLDGGEHRAVASIYDVDAGFRNQVNRYIQDFETMLRTILAQPDGAQLGVTILSSDIGKLYVALAQAIERLT